MIRGVIFDMDGVVIDSGEVIYSSWNDIFYKEFSITMPREEVAQQLGKSPKDFTQHFIDKYRLKISNGELDIKIAMREDELAHTVMLKPGIKELMARLKGKYKMALATGASRKNAEYYVNKFGLGSYLDFVIGGDEVREAKPNPEIFLNAARNLNLKPGECVVIEDAILGITAAKRAGMKVISIPDAFTAHQDHSTADMQLKSAFEISDNILKKLGDNHGQE